MSYAIPARSIVVSPLARAGPLIATCAIRSAVLCLAPEDLAGRDVSLGGVAVLTLAMHDIEVPMAGKTPPQPEHVRQLEDFVSRWDATAPLLICCRAGLSRSPAAAFVAACILNPHTDEAVIAQHLRTVSPRAWPNRLLVSLADRHLGRNGRMVRALDGMGVADVSAQNEVFVLPSSWA